MELSPQVKTLITEINAINHAWKEASEQLLAPNAPLATSLRDLKTSLQIRLLRNYPQQVYLILDDETESKEAVYSIRLHHPIDEYWNAAHIPARVATKILTPEELEQLIVVKNTEAT